VALVTGEAAVATLEMQVLAEPRADTGALVAALPVTVRVLDDVVGVEAPGEAAAASVADVVGDSVVA